MSGTHPPDAYPDVAALIVSEQPAEPVYCIYPHVYQAVVETFVANFPGRVLYAVKSNDDPAVIRLLNQSGITHFDCASVPEIAAVSRLCPGSTCYFMVPVRLRGAARQAFDEFGVRHFMIDHASGIDALKSEIDLAQVVVFVRLAVHHKAALQDLSSKYGAPPEQVCSLLQAVKASGAEPALAFNVGSSVTRPEAYEHAFKVAAGVLGRLPFQVRLVDMGGGFPQAYPGFEAPALEEFFAVIRQARASLPMATGGELMTEPGRALSAAGLSAVVEVLLRKGSRLYINDGMYGIFWELRFKGHKRYPVRTYRDGRIHSSGSSLFRVYGPTCDATDELPAELELPRDIRPGDHLEFGRIGAYSLAGRTRFNGFFSDRVIEISSPAALPPE